MGALRETTARGAAQGACPLHWSPKRSRQGRSLETWAREEEPMNPGKIVHLDPHRKTVAQIIDDLVSWQHEIEGLVVAVRREGQAYSVSYSLADATSNVEVIGALEVVKSLLAHDEVFGVEEPLDD